MSTNQATEQQQQQKSPSNHSSSSSSPSNSISLIRLDELSSFGATKQSRLPALIKLNDNNQQIGDQQNNTIIKGRQPNSMPTMSAEQMEQSQMMLDKPQVSLPAQVRITTADKENVEVNEATAAVADLSTSSADDFQVVDMVATDLVGPSLPQPQQVQGGELQGEQEQTVGNKQQVMDQPQRAALLTSQQFSNGQHPSHLGDSLIEMIINLKNENQNLVRALETNNEYVKERITEFKRVQEEAKKREAQFAMEKAEYEHQARKLQRQNMVLSERLKSMEAKLKDMKLEVSQSLVAAQSSKTSSVRGDSDNELGQDKQLYPNLMESESFTNSALNNQATIMMDATSDELCNDNNNTGASSPTAPPMDTDSMMRRNLPTAGPSAEQQTEPLKVGSMTKEELSKRFDANKTQFYAMDDDPMKECDKLEQQLNDIGKRDYEICLLQQQLNIYRQDFRLERMANLEAKIQIEKLKSDIERLCFDRLQEKNRNEVEDAATSGGRGGRHHRGHHRSSGSGVSGVRFDAAASADAVISKLGHHLSKKAAKSAAKAAKYASKQAHKEEKAAAVAAATAAATAAANNHMGATSSSGRGEAAEMAPSGGEQYNRRHHHHSRLRGVRSEVVNDLLSTANKAMLTGYKMASTHVNLALDKLSQYEQDQAKNLAENRQSTGVKATAPPMGPPSVD